MVCKEKIIRWCKAALVRAIRTMAQTALSVIGTSTTFGEVKWELVIGSTILAGVACILTCLKGLPEIKGDVYEEN